MHEPACKKQGYQVKYKKERHMNQLTNEPVGFHLLPMIVKLMILDLISCPELGIAVHYDDPAS